MTARPNTWMPIYPGDYLRDTGHLSTVEHGAYFLLMLHAWASDGLLPADDNRVRSIAKMGCRQWQLSRSTLMEFWNSADDGLRNPRLDKELAKAGMLTEQRRSAGRASSVQRALKSRCPPVGTLVERPLNERCDFVDPPVGTLVERALNSRCPSVDPSVDISLQRNGRPSPSQVEKKDKSPSAPSLANGSRLPEDGAPTLFGDGLAALAHMAGKQPDAMRAALGLLRKDAKDDGMLFDLIREAEHQSVVDPIPWMKAAIKARKSATLTLFTVPDEPDPCGIRAWIARRTDTEIGIVNGIPVACIGNYSAETVACVVADAAGLPETWRGNWDALADWMRDNIAMQGAQIAAIRGQAGRMRSQGQTIGSMAVFDNAVRTAARSAS